MALDELDFPSIPAIQYPSNESYFRERLKLSNNSGLLELAQLYDIPAPSPQEGDTSLWAQDRLRVFLSFISAHGNHARDVKKELERLGIHAFLSHIDIEANTLWQETIAWALNSCDALVALLTPGYHESHWTDQEVGWAYGRNIPVIGVRLGIDPYGFIGKIQGVSAHDSEQIAKEVIAALKRDERSAHKVDSSFAHALAASPSFTTTRLLVPYLEDIEEWDTNMIATVERAMEQNRWVYEAHYRGIGNPLLPQLEALLARHKSQPRSSGEVDDLPFE